MTVVTTQRRIGLMVAVLALLATTLAMIVGTAAPTEGAYPGANGKIVVNGFSGLGEIWVTDADGSNPTNITNNPANDRQPRWSPDGSKVIFASDRTGNFEIHTMNPDGTNVTQVTVNPAIVSGSGALLSA